jgi:hypothetical protein
MTPWGVEKNRSVDGAASAPTSGRKKEMNMRKSAFVMCVIAAMLVAGAAVAADWQKLGKKTVIFGNTEDSASITAKGEAVGQIAFKISGDWVRLNQVTLNFADGSTQTINEIEKVKPGLTSSGIAIDGGPKTITSIDFTFQAASSSRQGRGTVTVLGQ